MDLMRLTSPWKDNKCHTLSMGKILAKLCATNIIIAISATRAQYQDEQTNLVGINISGSDNNLILYVPIQATLHRELRVSGESCG